MEDILSSIKRIIAEDSEATLSAPRPRRAVAPPPPPTSSADDDGDDILELTDPVAIEAPAVRASTDAAAPQRTSECTSERHGAAGPPIAFAATPPAPAAFTSAPLAADRADAAPAMSGTSSAGPAPLVSPTTVDASRSALAALSSLIVRPEVAGGDTLEGLVRELLKPMLADWLDAKLPDVVERLVAQEIRRITERG